ncbi:MAG: transcription termination factor NusA [Candidatus Pacebacteria bacterium]|nr:transcription termination factor NusA [Candidatus Paceibacterota bacterium]MDD2757307.1 transcription termination factor NusA [Candidatus Paceibacterota bacterium]MDD3283839.1 transcription termination factor NusA [Candidatus Paceibacterota bacterium]MDD3970022.1 transcription termination factor NusA [Candidatus Paceibacterota bacterium]MDD4738057.1 transcription termination factor NusA [Candidatus Paceibacterota bacterium]
MDFQSFLSAINQISEEKGLSSEKIIETVEHALASAYKKEYAKRGQIIKAKINPKNGKTEFSRIMLVVDDTMVYIPERVEGEEEETFKVGKSYRPTEEELNSEEPKEENTERRVRYNEEKHLLIEEAKKKGDKVEPGEEIVTLLEPKEDFGRIAAQTAKQVVLQKIREAEKEIVLEEYKSKEGEIVSGIVQRIEGSNIYFDIGKSLGVLPREEQIRGEFYKEGQRLKLYILRVDTTPRGPVILLSRSYPKLISRLFELEVPEIQTGQLEIKSIAREPGSRTKIAVSAQSDEIDAIGSMVGQRGVRVTAVMSELGGEKIDIIEYNEDPVKFILNSLSPAKISDVITGENNAAIVVVPQDQLSLAIGKDGQNVRLAAKLTGWKLDIKGEGEQAEEEELDIDEEEVEETKEEN